MNLQQFVRVQATALTMLVVACASSSHPLVTEGRPPAPHVDGRDVLVIRNVRLFDGTRLIPRTDVAVRADRIVSIGPGAEVPDGARVLDGDGLTLLPGLIDAHAHVLAAPQLAQSAAFGVTTVLDMGTVAAVAAKLKAELTYDGPVRADLRSAGTLVTVPGGHGTEYGPIPTIATAEDAPRFVDDLVRAGSDYIKLVYDDGRAYEAHIPTLSPAMLSAGIAAAHRNKRLAIIHVSTLDEAREAVADGADGLAHVFADTVAGDAFVKLVADRHAFVVPTLSVLRITTNTTREPDAASDPQLEPYLPLAAQQNLKKRLPFAAPRLAYARAEETVRALHAAHVPLLAGTDAPNPGTTYGATLHTELELLVNAGLTPTEALAAATSVPASRFGLGDRGRIAPGMRADMLLVRGDPTVDVRATRAIVSVWKAGVSVDRDSLRSAVASEKSTAAKEREAIVVPSLGEGVVSDFEDGNPTTKFGSGWTAMADTVAGGKSRAEIRVAPTGLKTAKTNTKALRVEGDVIAGFALPWAGAVFCPGASPLAPANLSTTKGLALSVRGDGKTYRVMLFSSTMGPTPVMRTFQASQSWKTVSFDYTDFPGIDPHEITAIAIVAGPALGSFRLEIDDVRLMATEVQP